MLCQTIGVGDRCRATDKFVEQALEFNPERVVLQGFGVGRLQLCQRMHERLWNVATTIGAKVARGIGILIVIIDHRLNPAAA